MSETANLATYHSLFFSLPPSPFTLFSEIATLNSDTHLKTLLKLWGVLYLIVVKSKSCLSLYCDSIRAGCQPAP
jgi:hypothetical protein